METAMVVAMVMGAMQLDQMEVETREDRKADQKVLVLVLVIQPQDLGMNFLMSNSVITTTTNSSVIWE